MLKGSSWADTETPKESTKPPENKLCPHHRHPDILPLFPQPSPSPMNLPALRPALGSSGGSGKQKSPGGCLAPPAHPAGRARAGSSPCCSRSCSCWHTGAGRWIPHACISPPWLLFTCQFSTLNSSTSPLVTPRKHTVMKSILCYLSATQITALPVLQAPAAAQELILSQPELLPKLWLDAPRAVFRSLIRASSDAVPRSIHQGPSLLSCLQFSLLTIPKNEYILITVFWELGLFSF